jgi:hypothetical protein
MKAIGLMVLVPMWLLSGCATSNWPMGGGGYGNPGYGYGYGAPGYGYRGGAPGFGWGGYQSGYDQARAEDWRRWQAYQYGLSQGRQQGQNSRNDWNGGGGNPQGKPNRPPPLPYGITQNRNGTYNVPGYGDFTAGQIQNYRRKKR